MNDISEANCIVYRNNICEVFALSRKCFFPFAVDNADHRRWKFNGLGKSQNGIRTKEERSTAGENVGKFF